MQSFRSDIAFVGERNYVHGPTFFEAFRDHVPGSDAEPAAFALRFLRVNRMVHANGTIIVATGDEPRPDWGKPAVEMSCCAGSRFWYTAFYERDASPITRRSPAREREFVHDLRLTAPFCGDAGLHGMYDQADLFQAVVEANKQVHMKTLTDDPLSAAVKFRFAYCLDYTCAPRVGDSAGRISVRSEGLRTAGAYQFSLTALTLQIGNFSCAFKLCFASADMPGLAS